MSTTKPLNETRDLRGVVWITGLSAAGKTTTSTRLIELLREHGTTNVERLDGEDIRELLDRQYGYSEAERFEVVKQVVARALEFYRQGKLVIVSTISHKRQMRDYARSMLPSFLEVYLSCPVDVCAQRDYKNHYARALTGEIDNFIGVTEQYEISDPELTIDTSRIDSSDAAQLVYRQLLEKFEASSGNGTAGQQVE